MHAQETTLKQTPIIEKLKVKKHHVNALWLLLLFFFSYAYKEEKN
jgi:hypothetical protein